MNPHLRVLEYVRNTNGHATSAIFKEDHEPIGEALWIMLTSKGLVREDESGAIFLSDVGNAILDGKS